MIFLERMLVIVEMSCNVCLGGLSQKVMLAQALDVLDCRAPRRKTLVHHIYVFPTRACIYLEAPSLL